MTSLHRSDSVLLSQASEQYDVLLEMIGAHTAADSVVLDIGAGCGHNDSAARLKSMVGHVVGIDPSPRILTNQRTDEQFQSTHVSGSSCSEAAWWLPDSGNRYGRLDGERLTIPRGLLMFRHRAHMPELIPQLARGKHRNPRKGACFMELASYLAGERWSDHPACTHPLLAMLARLVNDHTSDAARGRLVWLVPSVVGLTADDPHVDVEIALRSATTALPVVSAPRQRAMAVSVLAADGALAALDGRAVDRLEERSRVALARVPHAAHWARLFVQEVGATPRGFYRHGAPTIVRHAVIGIAQSCVPDPDDMLNDLLTGAIQDCEAWAHGHPDPVAAESAPTPERRAWLARPLG